VNIAKPKQFFEYILIGGYTEFT